MSAKSKFTSKIEKTIYLKSRVFLPVVTGENKTKTK